jgi:hypothetical protein
MNPRDDSARLHAADASAGECCAQAQMASYARLEAMRHARERAEAGADGWLQRLLGWGLRSGKR